MYLQTSNLIRKKNRQIVTDSPHSAVRFKGLPVIAPRVSLQVRHITHALPSPRAYAADVPVSLNLAALPV
jgi:hypothetical protein